MAMDPAQQVAQARANLMLRGYAPLAVIVGQQSLADLRDYIDPGNTLFGMPVSIAANCEGFLVHHNP